MQSLLISSTVPNIQCGLPPSASHIACIHVCAFFCVCCFVTLGFHVIGCCFNV